MIDSNGWTPLHRACNLGDLDITSKLIEEGADILAVSNKGYLPVKIIKKMFWNKINKI